MIMGKDLTPAQKQYMELKNDHKDCILFFRMGDFYETFREDAKIASKKLWITLTSKNKNADEPVPMAWVPAKSADKYISQLVKAGYKVAKAEQVWDVVPGKLVKRQVVEVITPWTYIDNAWSKDYNYLASVFYSDKDGYQIAWWDFSIGKYWTKTYQNFEDMLKFLVTLDPAEIVIDIDFSQKDELENYIKDFGDSFISIYSLPDDVEYFLKSNLEVQTVSSYWKAFEKSRDKVFALLLNYIVNTQKTNIKNISSISFWWERNKVHLDDVTIKNLEVFESSYEGSQKHSLIWVIDKTNTAMWRRLISFMLKNPVCNISLINDRLENINYYMKYDWLRKELIDVLSGILDIQRIISKILHKKNSPFLFAKLKSNLASLFDTEENVQNIDIDNFVNKIQNSDFKDLDSIWEKIIYELLRIWLSKKDCVKVLKFYKNLNAIIKDDGFSEQRDYIKDWVDEQIDKFRKIAYKSDDILMEYQSKVSDKIWAKAKLKYTKTGGYFLEVRKTHNDKLEKFLDSNQDRFNSDKEYRDKYQLVRKKTLKYAERYITNHLKELEEKILTAKDKLKQLEKQILKDMQKSLQNVNKNFAEFVDQIAYLDVYTSHSKFAKQKGWCKPKIKQWYNIDIQEGRHPVIEKFLPKDEEFISNNLDIKWEKDSNWNIKSGRVNIITWPNMGGKSTYLRQNAIIVLLAHCGFYVPASKANISLVDGIFARVWAGDLIAKNQSTFMTEMVEMSNILHNSTSKSFVILDELGRGTCTYDGMALAKAVISYMAQNIKSKCLFATHYHELIELEDQIDGIENYSVSVYETDQDVVFMKKIVKWGASKSYGIQVAKLAGIPNSIVKDAQNNLQELKSSKDNTKTPKSQMLFDKLDFNTDKYKTKYQKLVEKIKNIDINNTTPLEAMSKINDLKEFLDRI